MKRIYAYLVFISLFLVACGIVRTSPFGDKAFILIPTPQEVSIGRQAASQIEKKVKLCKDPVINEYVEFIGKKIAAVSDRHDIIYHFKVIESDELNAFALPGGWVYIYTGLLRHLRNEAELAFVLGHEVGHIVGRHAVRRLQFIYGIDFILSLLLGGKRFLRQKKSFSTFSLTLLWPDTAGKKSLKPMLWAPIIRERQAGILLLPLRLLSSLTLS